MDGRRSVAVARNRMGHGASTKAKEGATLARRPGSLYAPTPKRIEIGTDIGNILCCPLSADLTDLTGNHVFDYGTPSFGTADSTHGSYDGGTMMIVENSAALNPRIIADGAAAHQIPHTSPVTFGAFIYPRVYNGSPAMLCSGNGGFGNNYGLYRQSTAGWQFLGNGQTSMGNHKTKTPIQRWFHVCMAVSANRTTSPAAAFYLNGREVWSGTVNAEAVQTTDNFALTSDADDTSAAWEGLMCNAFVTDTLLSAATIKNLSDESFGHASPWMG